MRNKTQLVVRRGEGLAAAAEDQTEATRGDDRLTTGGLTAAAASTRRAALAQADTFDRWARDAAADDALLARAVRELADTLRAVAERADRVRDEARDALDALDEDPV